MKMGDYKTARSLYFTDKTTRDGEVITMLKNMRNGDEHYDNMVDIYREPDQKRDRRSIDSFVGCGQGLG